MSKPRNTSPESLQGWFAGRLPDGWFTEAPEVTNDRDEILVVGKLAEPDLPKDASAEARTSALQARISPHWSSSGLK